MSNLYCPACGTPHELVAGLNFCSACGGKMVVNPKLPPKPVPIPARVAPARAVRRRADDEGEEYEDENFQLPEIETLAVKITETKPRGITFKDALTMGPTGFKRPKEKTSAKKLKAELQKEMSPTQRNDPKNELRLNS